MVLNNLHTFRTDGQSIFDRQQFYYQLPVCSEIIDGPSEKQLRNISEFILLFEDSLRKRKFFTDNRVGLLNNSTIYTSNVPMLTIVEVLSRLFKFSGNYFWSLITVPFPYKVHDERCTAHRTNGAHYVISCAKIICVTTTIKIVH